MSVHNLEGIKTKEDLLRAIAEAEIGIIEICNTLIADHEVHNNAVCGLLFDMMCNFRNARYTAEED